ncbi:aldolase/citrate lyase family protein [Bremerella sp. JC770]|uniref:HpcH/HpaI aldolase family protein n=1 Tax=Bremerella sp. JC770 TaxID=3232137 RepID=UPI003457F491
MGLSFLQSQLRAFRHSATLPIVRVRAIRGDLMGRLLDWGAAGIMVLHVNTFAQAQAYVQAMRYPPMGTRGVSRSVRAYRFRFEPIDINLASPTPLLMVQIETSEAVLQAEQIAQVDGVDVLFVGPADLNYDLDHGIRSHGLTYPECLKHVVSAARNHGKSTGILMRGSSEPGATTPPELQWLAVESDLGILRNTYQSLLQRIPPRNPDSCKS